jgi:thioredoxin-related protein
MLIKIKELADALRIKGVPTLMMYKEAKWSEAIRS